MSLKSFHIVFIVAAGALALLFGLWGIDDWRTNGITSSLWLGIGSLIVGACLVPYGIWFLRKTRKVGYL